MTRDEALKIAVIASGVDGGCPQCVENVLHDLNTAFPEFDWDALMKEVPE